MNAVMIKQCNKELVVSGDINFDTVVLLRQWGDSLINEINKTIIINFKGVKQCDSTGLALMTACKRTAKKANRVVEFINVPPSLHAIADVCNVSEILGLT